MNEFRIRATGEVVTEPEFRAQHDAVFPSVLDAATLASWGADPVLVSPAPTVAPLEMAVRVGAIKDARGNWVQAWQIVARFADAAADAAYLAQRLGEARAALHDAVAARRQSAQERGCIHRFPDGLTGTIQTRNALDLGNITGQTLAAMILQGQGVVLPVLVFRDEQNVSHQMTPAEMLNMGMASSAFVSATYAAKWGHDSAIDQWAGNTVYDINVGWPE